MVKAQNFSNFKKLKLLEYSTPDFHLIHIYGILFNHYSYYCLKSYYLFIKQKISIISQFKIILLYFTQTNIGIQYTT